MMPSQFRLRSLFILTAIVAVLLIVVPWLYSAIPQFWMVVVATAVILAGQAVIFKLLIMGPPPHAQPPGTVPENRAADQQRS